MFEMNSRDAFGRIGSLTTAHGDIITPTILPVVDPIQQEIPPARILEETDACALITNAFLLYRDEKSRKKVLETGIHDFLGVDCPVATDSGGYQIYRGRRVGVSPDKIHMFQADIGSDLAVVLDMPPRDDMDLQQASICIDTSIDRSRELMGSAPEGPLWYGVVHLTPHDRLRDREIKAISGMDFDVFALGSCVGSLIEYRFESHLDRLMKTARQLDPSVPRHVFGAGHPMFLAISAAFGGDLFDSAMYTLAASDGRYLTENGTRRVDDMLELPCDCPACRDSDPEDMVQGARGRKLLSLHNLHNTFRELRKTREAIRSNSLWELVQTRCRSHPRLLGAVAGALEGHGDFLQTVDPLYKKSALFHLGPETSQRPEVKRAARRARERLPDSNVHHHPLYGDIPWAVSLCYPFGQTVLPSELEGDFQEVEERTGSQEIVEGSIDYQLGPGCGRCLRPYDIFRSPRTNRIRGIEREGDQLGVFRANDFAFLPSMLGASILKEYLPWPSLRVAVSEEAVPFVSKGRSAFAKFVDDCDPELIPGQQVFLVDGEDELLATGTANMNAREMECFDVGVAVRVRHSLR